MDKKYLDRLADMIKNFNLDHKVSFVPFLESPMEIMSFLDLVILPTYEETFGLVVAESMLMGTPVIGSNAGGVPEIIEDCSNGLLFETKSSKSLKDKIIDMYDSEELRKKLSNNAKIFAMKNYDYQMHFSNLDKILSKL
jgi:glycosyltransferase involved in cell wall biosynthesis